MTTTQEPATEPATGTAVGAPVDTWEDDGGAVVSIADQLEPVRTIAVGWPDDRPRVRPVIDHEHPIFTSVVLELGVPDGYAIGPEVHRALMLYAVAS